MSITVMKQALEALENLQGLCSEESGFVEQVTIWTPDAIYALRTAIAEAEKQEPVAWQGVYDKTDLYYRKPVQGDVRPLYTTPFAAQRKPLTEDQIDDIWNRYCDEMGEASINDAYDIARAIEAAHGITGEKT
jgi:hypothetical protein